MGTPAFLRSFGRLSVIWLVVGVGNAAVAFVNGSNLYMALAVVNLVTAAIWLERERRDRSADAST